MEKDIYKMFKAIYLFLDEIWEKNQDEDLRVFLSDADPTFCEDGKSIDPAVFEDFKQIYNQISKNLDNYEFILYYLSNLDPYYGDIKKYLLSIPREECEIRIADILREM